MADELYTGHPHELAKVKTSLTDSFGGQTAVRWAGRARLFAQRGVFIQCLIGKVFGTGQNRSFKRGVRLTSVFVRRGSTQTPSSNYMPIIEGRFIII